MAWGVPSSIRIDGVAGATFAVFLPAGDRSCDGAVAYMSLSAGDKLGGPIVGGRVVVTLATRVLHKLCVSFSVAPITDTAFELVEGVLLEVTERSPPPSAPPVPPPHAPPPGAQGETWGREDTTLVFAIGVSVLIVLCAAFACASVWGQRLRRWCRNRGKHGKHHESRQANLELAEPRSLGQNGRADDNTEGDIDSAGAQVSEDDEMLDEHRFDAGEEVRDDESEDEGEDGEEDGHASDEGDETNEGEDDGEEGSEEGTEEDAEEEEDGVAEDDLESIDSEEQASEEAAAGVMLPPSTPSAQLERRRGSETPQFAASNSQLDSVPASMQGSKSPHPKGRKLSRLEQQQIALVEVEEVERAIAKAEESERLAAQALREAIERDNQELMKAQQQRAMAKRWQTTCSALMGSRSRQQRKSVVDPAKASEAARRREAAQQAAEAAARALASAEVTAAAAAGATGLKGRAKRRRTLASTRAAATTAIPSPRRCTMPLPTLPHDLAKVDEEAGDGLAHSDPEPAPAPPGAAGTVQSSHPPPRANLLSQPADEGAGDGKRDDGVGRGDIGGGFTSPSTADRPCVIPASEGGGALLKTTEYSASSPKLERISSTPEEQLQHTDRRDTAQRPSLGLRGADANDGNRGLPHLGVGGLRADVSSPQASPTPSDAGSTTSSVARARDAGGASAALARARQARERRLAASRSQAELTEPEFSSSPCGSSLKLASPSSPRNTSDIQLEISGQELAF